MHVSLQNVHICQTKRQKSQCDAQTLKKLERGKRVAYRVVVQNERVNVAWQKNVRKRV
jgi:hypothetical protein